MKRYLDSASSDEYLLLLAQRPPSPQWNGILFFRTYLSVVINYSLLYCLQSNLEEKYLLSSRSLSPFLLPLLLFVSSVGTSTPLPPNSEFLKFYWIKKKVQFSKCTHMWSHMVRAPYLTGLFELLCVYRSPFSLMGEFIAEQFTVKSQSFWFWTFLSSNRGKKIFLKEAFLL